MIAEPKRRGRPPKAREVENAAIETEEVVEADGPDEEVQPEQPVKPSGPPCSFCARPMLRSTKLLRRYELVALKCDKCRHIGIEGDDQWFDLNTAACGNPSVVLVRAMAIYSRKHYAQPPPPLERDRGAEAAMSDWGDPRWTEFEF